MDSAGSPSVWHVDDNPGDLELVSIALDGCGIRLRSFLDGRVALDSLHAARPEELPALLLLDIGMPGFDGLAFLRLVQAETRFGDLRVCVLTGGDVLGASERVLNLGASRVLSKPKSVPEFQGLREAVLAALSGSDPAAKEARRGTR